MLTKLFTLASLAASSILADVPVSCPYSSTLGYWKFSIGFQGSSQSLVKKCGLDNLGPVTKTYTFLLEEKDQVTNVETGSKGTYTIVSSQGFEISIDGRRWWAYYYFDEKDRKNNDCTKTMVGYQRDNLLKSWSCIQGGKVDASGVAVGPVNDSFYTNLVGSKAQHDSASNLVSWADKQEILSQMYQNDDEFIDAVNIVAKTWTAKNYPEFEKYTFAEMQARQGFEVLEWPSKSHTLTDMEKLDQARSVIFPEDLPSNWDWRNVNGRRYDSPVWDQASCGSCFAFAAKSFLEARVRIQTDLTSQPIFSVQEMITCAAEENYNQGCSGGFAYLVAGKEMFERGIVDESCNLEEFSYNYSNTTCPDTSSCKKWYASDYEYLGGFYGAATVDTMLRALHDDGPLSVGIAVPSDFRGYAKGIWYSTLMTPSPLKWDPLEPTGHAVVIVGYGRCPSTVTEDDPNCNLGDDDLPYWIVKNSWGSSWGENGYIRVLLGVDEIYIESKPVVSSPIQQY